MLILIKYGPENPAETWKLGMATADDTIVLLQNGVFWAITDEGRQALDGKQYFALAEDLDARGYATDGIPCVDYAGLVELIEANPKAMS